MTTYAIAHLRNVNFGAEIIAYLEGIDAKSDGALKFSAKKEGVLREPDALKWLDDNRFVVANEGDYEGGSRSFKRALRSRSAVRMPASCEASVVKASQRPEL